MLKRTAATAATLLLVAACADSPTTPTVQTAMSPVFAVGGVGPSATGSGSFMFGANNRTFSFTARVRSDGSVDGQWQRVTHNGGPNQSKSHGQVTCLTIVDNQAWIGGFKTSGTTFTDPPNNEVAWHVIDNGQGSKAEPDQMSGQSVGGAPGFAANYCASTPDTNLFDLAGGNIQVRD